MAMTPNAVYEYFADENGTLYYKLRSDYTDCGTLHTVVPVGQKGTLLTNADKPAGYHLEVIDCSGYQGGTADDDPASTTDFSGEGNDVNYLVPSA